MAFKYVPPSKKQLMLLSWWMAKENENKEGIIAEGAIRAGKTIFMGLSFFLWACSTFEGQCFAVCGKSVSSAERNLMQPLIPLLLNRGFRIIWRKQKKEVVATYRGNTNTFYIFGGKDEGSQDYIQGLTLAGVLFDEVALMPQSFVEQALGRCSVEGSKQFYNCNPAGPRHWFKLDKVDKAGERNLVRLHFSLTDNPSLSKEKINNYMTMFTGIFYKRFILGEWAFADGVIYQSIPEDTFYTDKQEKEVVPIKILEGDVASFYGVDCGTVNPQVYLELYKYFEPGVKTPFFYVTKEYCWNSREKFKQKTDEEYKLDLQKFIGEKKYNFVIVDPSASSFITTIQKSNIIVRKAKNDVGQGIAMVNTLFTMGHIKINKDKCPNLVQELAMYQWDAKKSERGLEEPVKQNDHSCDALRYAIFTTTFKGEIYGG